MIVRASLTGWLISLKILAFSQANLIANERFVDEEFQDILIKIEKKYPVRFFYQHKWLPAGKWSITFDNTPMVEVLNEVLADVGLQAEHYNAYVIIIGPKRILDQQFSQDFYDAVEDETNFESPGADTEKMISVGSATALHPRGRAKIKIQLIDEETEEAVAGAVVTFFGISQKVIADPTGSLSVVLPIKTHEVFIQSTGYEDLLQKIVVYNDGEVVLKIPQKPLTLDEVVITSRDQKTYTGLTSLSVQHIKDIPSFLGEPDVIKGLLNLPGVSNVGEGASGFNVRGGNTDQNMVVFDEIMLFNTTHAFGFFGAINPDIVKRINFYRGTMPAYYGGRLSSVLDIHLKEGDKNNFKMMGGVGPFSAKVTLEGPVIKDKSSLIFSTRSTYSDWILRTINVPDIKQSAVFFMDAMLRYHHQMGKSSLLVSSYFGKDDFRLSNQFGFDYTTQALSVNFSKLISEKFTSSLSGAYSSYRSSRTDFQDNNASRLDIGIDYAKLKEQLIYDWSERIKIDFGGSVIFYRSKPGDIRPLNEISVVKSKNLEDEKAFELAGFVSGEWLISNNISISAGLRASHYQLMGPGRYFLYENPERPEANAIRDSLIIEKGDKIVSYRTLEPRVSLNYKVSSDHSLKLGYSRTAQYIFQISNTDTPTPVDIWKLSNRHLPPPKAHNFSIDAIGDFFASHWTLSLGAYFRKMTNISDYKDFADLLVNHHLETEIINTVGRAYGLEINLEKNIGKLTGDWAYTWSRSERKVKTNIPGRTINNGEWYPSNFDKPHELTMLLSYQFNKRHGVALNFTYFSGRPVTAPVGFFDPDGTIRVPIYSERNTVRIPDYHRLDVSYTVGQGHRKNKKWRSSWTFGIYNIYGRRNAYSIFFTQVPLSNLQANRFSVLGSAFPAITYHFKFNHTTDEQGD